MPFICPFPLTVFEVSLTDIIIPLTEIEFSPTVIEFP